MKLSDIKTKFKKETKADVYNGGNGLCKWEYSVEYVEWLEKQLLLHNVSQQRELLLFFLSKINKDAIDLYNEGKGQIVIDHFLKNNNCG